MKVLGFEIKKGNAPVSVISENKGKQNPSTLSIVQGFKDNSRKDIDKWRMALRMATALENPSLKAYYDLVEDLLTDGHLQSQIQMRKSAILNTEFYIVDDKGDIHEDLTTFVKKQWFFQFLAHAVDSIFYGTSVIEFQNIATHMVKHLLVPRQHTVPSLSRIIPNMEEQEQFINYTEPPYNDWIIQIGGEQSFGILNNIVPNIIWKRNVAQSWAEFCERFGLPLITATCNTTDQKVIDNVLGLLKDLGESAHGAFPTGTKVEFHEANRTDAFNVYKQFIQTNADEISKQILGSTMLSDQGSNRSQTEVHERNLDNKITQTDKRTMAFAVNNQLFPLLRQHGIQIPDGAKFIFQEVKPQLKPMDMWTITNGLLDKGYEVDDQWLSKTFNIPLKEGVKKKAVTVTSNTTASISPSIERYPFSCDCGDHIQALGGKIGKRLDELTKQAAQLIYNKKNIEGWTGEFVATEANTLVAGMREHFKTTSPYTGPDLLALQLMEYNLFEFTESKVEARLATMQNLLVDPDTKQIRSFSQFEALAQKEVAKYNRAWLQSEYNLSIAVGQTSAQYYRFMAEKDSVTNLVKYQTVGDSSVRSAHQVLNGKIFSLDDSEAMDLFPPNGYGCRCEMVQHIGKGKTTRGTDGKGLLHSRDPKFRKSPFDVNRANLKKVFSKKQFYTDNDGLANKLNKRTFDKYGLKPYSTFKNTLKPLKLDSTITQQNFKKDLWKPIKGKALMPFADYLGRKMIMTEKTFDHHTTGHYLNQEQQRHQLFPHIKEVLNNPDEVWLYEYSEDTFKTYYMKFYKNIPFVVRTEMQKDLQALNINTWFNMKDETSVRKGIKIK